MTSKQDLARGILWTTFLQDDKLVAALRDDSKIDVFDAENDLEHKKIFNLDDYFIHGCDSKIIATKESAVDFVDVNSLLKTVSTYKPSKSFKVFDSSQFESQSTLLVVTNNENCESKKRVEFVDWRTANVSNLLLDQNTPIGDRVVFTEKPEQFAVTTSGGAVNLYDIRTAKNGQPIYQVQNTGKLRRLTFVNNRMCCITPGDAFKIYTKNECFEFQKEEYRYEFPNREDWCLGFLEGNDKCPLFAIHGNRYNFINFSAVDQIGKTKVPATLRYKALRPNCFSTSSNNKIAVGSSDCELHLQICNFRSDNLHKEYEKIRDKNTKGRGTFRYVQLVESVRTGKKFAMKVLPNTLADLADRHVVEREILI